MEIKSKTLYDITDLTFENIELICLGLDELKETDIDNVYKVKKLIKLLESALPKT